MVSQKQIKEWIPSVVSTFTATMPPISAPLPDIRIASASTLHKVRDELLAQTGSTNTNTAEYYTSVMETLSGPYGTGILIYQKYCPETFEEFRHTLWHELGHYYAVSVETENFNQRYAAQKETDDMVGQAGYWMWMEFVADAISNYVYEKAIHENFDILDDKNWRPVYLKPQHLIQCCFNGEYVDEGAIGHYLATVITDKHTRELIAAVDSRKLQAWVPSRGMEVVDPEKFDVLAIRLIEKDYVAPLMELKELMAKHMQQKPFWIIDEEFLSEMGDIVMSLRTIKNLKSLHLGLSSLANRR